MKKKATRGQIDPITGITDGAMKALLKSVLRPCWRRTSRKTFIDSVRYHAENPKTGRNWFVIDCADCQRVMGVSEKEFRTLKAGGKSKKPRSVYEIHHKSGVTSLAGIRETLGEHFHSLIYGEMEVLCFSCHAAQTAEQTSERNKNKGLQPK
jgi:hypothetical protein